MRNNPNTMITPFDAFKIFSEAFDPIFQTGHIGNLSRNSLFNKNTTLLTDYFYEDEKIVLNVDVAGSASEDVSVNFDKESFTISVRVNKKYEKKDSKPTFYVRERVLSEQARHFKLPTDIDVDSILADVKNGLLTIKATIVKPEEKPTPTVTIKVN